MKGFEVMTDLTVKKELSGREEILIAGAGVSGLEAALKVIDLGYTPIIYEQSEKAGGLVNYAMMPPKKQGMAAVFTSRVEKLEKLGVKINYLTPLTVDIIKKSGVCKVIVATGSSCLVPGAIPGIKDDNIYTSDYVFDHPEVVSKRVAVLGGGLVGCETATFLADIGKEITIIEMGAEISKDLNPALKTPFFKLMSELDIDVRSSVKVMGINLPEINLDLSGYSFSVKPFDTAVVAFGRRPIRVLADEIIEQLPHVKVYLVGDAKAVGTTATAVSSCTELAEELKEN